MSREIATQRAIESDDDKWNDHDREDRVRHEDREIDRANDAGALKACRAVVVVIDEIRSQKQYRNDECRELACAMSGDVSSSDECVPR